MKINKIIDKYILVFDDHIKYEEYSEKQYYGIIFFINNFRYEVIHNYDLGNRLIINGEYFAYKDIPFNIKTFDFLPSHIKAFELQDPTCMTIKLN